MSFWEKVIADLKGLWEKEKPTIETALQDVEKAAAPIWKTALGSIVQSTVAGLTGYAASNGGAAARTQAVTQIEAGLKLAGQTASKSTVNTLIELAVQGLNSATAGLTQTAAAPAESAPTPAAPATT